MESSLRYMRFEKRSDPYIVAPPYTLQIQRHADLHSRHTSTQHRDIRPSARISTTSRFACIFARLCNVHDLIPRFHPQKPARPSRPPSTSSNHGKKESRQRRSEAASTTRSKSDKNLTVSQPRRSVVQRHEHRSDGLTSNFVPRRNFCEIRRILPLNVEPLASRSARRKLLQCSLAHGGF